MKYWFIIVSLLVLMFSNKSSMTSVNTLPVLQTPRTHHFHINPPKDITQSVHQQTRAALTNRRYLYIDFQLQSTLLELEEQPQNEGHHPQDQIESIGCNRIGGMKQLKHLCRPSFQMHSFLNEEKELLQQRKRLSRRMNPQTFRESTFDFNRVQDKVNPQKLQEYLERKDLEHKWKQITAREESLIASNQSSIELGQQLKARQIQSLKGQLLKPKPKGRNHFKLKTLNKLNNLLHL